MRGMSDLQNIIKILEGNGEIEQVVFPSKESLPITSIFSNSRECNPGSLFCCIQGEKHDGHVFAADAVQRGAIALLCKRPLEINVPQIIVKDVRWVMGYAAAIVYDCPSEHLAMYGVTGTNGKSTSSYMMRSVLQASGEKSGLMGTIVYSDGDVEEEASRTTPESCDVQRYLARMVRNECKSATMEVSSHGAVQGRLNGCFFSGMIFTNLTPEHLDYHGDMEHYFMAKKSIFEKYVSHDWCGAINGDDEYGKRLLYEYKDHCLSYGLCSCAGHDVYPTWLEMGLSGLQMDVRLPTGKSLELNLPVTGRFNVYNALGVIALAYGVGINMPTIKRGLETMPQVPGRVEKYFFENGVCAVVDYAHTPDALQNVLSAMREICKGRLISVFGHGGERYHGNRPLLGQVASENADVVVVTMDNPRSEDPAQIAEEIEKGFTSSLLEHYRILNRQEAVGTALSMARPGDMVVISGKGPEHYILLQDKRIPYNDSETIKEWGMKQGLRWQ